MADNERSTEQPNPARITHRQDFARELTRARDSVGLTIREIARAMGMPTSTIGGYFGGAHLPKPGPPHVLERILAECGVTGDDEIDRWRQALRQARRAATTVPYRHDPICHRGAADDELDEQFQPRHRQGPPPPHAYHAGPPPQPTGGGAPTVSTRPPVHRLAGQPPVRGRDELLRLLAAQLSGQGTAGASQSTRVHVLHGLGGSGKSTVALALARDGLAVGVRTWWISATDAAQVNAGMAAIAVELGARPGRLRLGSAPDQVWRLLEHLREPWLLVLDDADDLLGTVALPGHRVSDATGWVRAITGDYGMVVVTSRDGSAATWGAAGSRWLHLHPVPPLSGGDGAVLVRAYAGESAGSLSSARRLASRLGGLPLALRAAGEFLREAGRIPAGIADGAEPRTFSAYLDALDQGRHRELFRGDDATPERGVVGRTWEMSLDLLDAKGIPQARPMLRLLSCLGPGRIPYALLLNAPMLAEAPMFPRLTGRRMWTVLTALASVGLVDLDWQDATDAVAAHTLSVPPLVRQASRLHQDVGHQLPRYLSTVTALLAAAVADLGPDDPAAWPRWRVLAEHCASPLELIREHQIHPADTPPEVLVPATAAAAYLRASGRLSRATQQYARLVAAGRRLLGEEHPDVIALRHDLGRAWYETGQYDRAKRELHTVLELRRRTLGPDHPDTLDTAHHLARALREHGQRDEAYPRFVEVFTRRRQLLGRDHLDTLDTATQVADLLRERGRLDHAEAIFHDVHAARRARLGPEHPATLIGRLFLARVASDRGQHAVAEADLRDLRTELTELLGVDHPWTLTACGLLADVCHRLGRWDEAETLVQEVVHARHRVLGYDHPATLAARHRLGAILQDRGEVDRGDLDAAEKELQAVLDARRQVLCAKHPDTARTEHRLDRLREARTDHIHANSCVSIERCPGR